LWLIITPVSRTSGLKGEDDACVLGSGVSAHRAAGRLVGHLVPHHRRARGRLGDRLPPAIPIALVLGLVNLVAALFLNRAPAPGQLPGGDDTEWTSRHRAGGTPLQCYSPYFLAAAGLFCAGWTLQWVHWLVAVAEYGALTAVYYAVPDFLRRPAKAITVAERGTGSPPSRATTRAAGLPHRSVRPRRR
jgi:hypothetical protein